MRSLKVTICACVMVLAHCFPVGPSTPPKAHCEYCFEGPCFNKASCNGKCLCFKQGGNQTGVCASVSYQQSYLDHGYTESK